MTKEQEFRKQTEEAKFEAFSLMCKKVADLEKENVELARKLKTETELSKRLGVAYREYEQLTKEQDEHLVNLEKENATLKKQLEVLSGDIPWNELKDVSKVTEELTEAKEIIRWFLVYEKGEGIITNYNNFLEQAEQFLKEIK